MLVNFTKMHGLGNDFVVIDLLTQSVRLHAHQIKRICDRNLGIGCDQLLLIEPPTHKDSHFFYRIYNANGQEVEQCGNGARCAARFFYDAGFLMDTHKIRADCLAGQIEFSIEADGTVSMTMPTPRFASKDIPYVGSHEDSPHTLILEEDKVDFSLVSMGNPHAIIIVPNIETAPVRKWGPLLSKHSHFPAQTNVEFMQIIDRNNIQLRIWERGVGETLACGSGACAAAVAGLRQDLLDNPVYVQFPHGRLKVVWEGGKHPVLMRGPATNVFVGRFRL